MNMRRMMRDFQRTIGIRQPSFLEVAGPALGALAVGMVAGAGIALFLAPTSGERLREDLSQKLNSAKSRLLAEGERLASEGANAAIGHHN
jgi:hypothetical protein